MAKLPSAGLIVVPRPPISMACVLGTNTSVGARHCPLVFCDVKVNAYAYAKRTGAGMRRCILSPWRRSRGDAYGPPGRPDPNMGSVPFLGNIHMGV